MHTDTGRGGNLGALGIWCADLLDQQLMSNVASAAGFLECRSAAWMKGCTAMALIQASGCGIYVISAISGDVWNRSRFVDWGERHA